LFDLAAGCGTLIYLNRQTKGIPEFSMEEISKILPHIFRGQVRRSNPRVVDILAPLWPLVAGKPMARHSRPVAFEDGLLTLESDCTAWSAEMRRMADDILAQINRYLGVPAVRKLKVCFVPGSFTAAPLPDKSQFN
jgi:hypothetical protein